MSFDDQTEKSTELVYAGKNNLLTNKNAIENLDVLSEKINEIFSELVGEDKFKTIGGILRVYKDQNRYALSFIVKEPLLEFYHDVTKKSPYLDFNKDSLVKRFYDKLLASEKGKILNQEQQKRWFTIREVYKRGGEFYDYLESLFKNKRFLKFSPSLTGCRPSITNYSTNLFVTFELKSYGIYYICPICKEKIIYEKNDYASIYCINKSIHPNKVMVFDDDYSINVTLDDGIHRLESNEKDFIKYLAIHKRAKLENSNFLTCDKTRFLTKKEYIVVYVENQTIKGYLCWNTYAKTKYIRQVYVKPGARRKGIATKLFECVVKNITEFTVETPNKMSIGLVKKFEQTHKIYYIHGF